MACNTAVFYDVENLISLFSSKNNKTLQLDEIHKRILNIDIVTGISVQRAYADWMLQTNRNLRSYILQIGIEPIQIFNTNQNDRVKNAADVSLIIDAVELIAKRPEIENYVIATGDGIFAFLAKKLHEYGKRVIGCGFDRTTNIIFKNSCDIFLALEKDDAALTATIKNSTKGTILTESDTDVVKIEPKKKQAKEVEVPNNLPKGKFTEVLLQSDIPIWKNSNDVANSLHILKRMINVLFNDNEEMEALDISLFKNYIHHYLPNFKIGHYGFKGFAEFMRFLVSGSPYHLFISEGTVIKMAKRSYLLSDSHTVMEDMQDLHFTLTDGSTSPSLFDIDDGVSFTFNLIKTAIKPEQKPKPKPRYQPPKLVAVSQDAPPSEPELVVNTISIRKFIKDSFTKLSEEDKLTAKEVKLLLTEDYSKKIFGIKVPVFKKLLVGKDLQEQRLIDGKVVYWKDEFKFKGKSYLIFKEWADKQHHRVRFETWLNEEVYNK